MAENAKNYDRFFKRRGGTVSVSTAGTAPNVNISYPGVSSLGPSVATDVSDRPMSSFTLQVVGVPSPATLWEIVLEGSIDGVTFSEIMKHTTNVGDGKNLYSGTTLFPVNYFRVNTTILTLGPATSLTVNLLGTE
jgi:hypothetical protein